MDSTLVSSTTQTSLHIDNTSNLYAFALSESQIPTANSDKQPMQFTFWDATDETVQGTTSQHCEIAVTDLVVAVKDEDAPSAVITPFYWNSETDNSLYYQVATSSGKTTRTRLGHIDLGQYGGRNGIPAVSGVIKLEGTAFDDQRLGTLTFNLTGSSAKSYTATYAPTTSTWTPAGTLTKTVDEDSGEITELTLGSEYYLEVEDVSFSQEGHKVKWTLYMNTVTQLGNGTSDSRAVTVTAKQAKTNAAGTTLSSTPGEDQTGMTSGSFNAENATGYYMMDVVPYITAIDRGSETSISGGYMNRSKLGHYPASEGEVLTVYGFNFGTSPIVRVGNTTVYKTGTTAISATESTISSVGSFTFTVPQKSGNIKVTSTTSSLNNKNADPVISGNKTPTDTAKNYNLETMTMKGNSTTYYVDDDRYIEVWSLGNYFKGTDGGAELQQPVMAADASGNLYASWGDQTNSQIRFSYGIANPSTAVFRCYDQPGNYTGIGFDQKGTSGAASLAFMAEHQGYGGTYSLNALASNAIVGGMGAISIPKTAITEKTIKSGLDVTLDENPQIYFDSTGNTSGYYSLESYDMIRRLGAFENPRSARYNTYLHTIWYDSVTESLRYSVANTSDKSKYNLSNGAIVGWVVLDGGFTGQDRLHSFKAQGGKANNTLIELSNYGHAGTGTKGANKNSNAANYSTDIFLASGQRTETVSYMKNITTTSVTMSGLSSGITPAKGDTIALMYNKEGSYAMSLRKISDVTGDKISWTDEVTHTIQSAAIYKGALNVVGGTLADLDNKAENTGSSGSSADIDVGANGYPVVAYFDDSSSTLRIAKASSAEPKLYTDWTRIETSFTCSGSVSMRIDGANNIHVMYKNEDGQLCYLFGAVSGTGYNFNPPEVIDETGSLEYGTLSVRELVAGTYVPVMTYMNSAGTAQAVKYAYRTSAPSYNASSEASTALSDDWDYMILPSLGSGHYAVSENRISLEAHKSGWTGTGDALRNGGSQATATPATVQAAVAFKSKQFETAYLRTAGTDGDTDPTSD